MNVVESISFFQELDLLEAHLEESQHWAKKIYIIESLITFSGQPKKLFFEENKDRFKRFENIVHLITPPDVFTPVPYSYPDEEKGHWYRERRKNRNLNRQFHWDTLRKDADYVYLNDTDEFVAASHWGYIEEMLKDKVLQYVSVRTRKFNFWVNARGSKQEQWRITRSDLPSFEMYKHTPRKTTPVQLGWHFTNCFSTPLDHHLKMLGICCHVGMSPSEIPSVELIEERLSKLIEPLVNVPMEGGIKEVMSREDRSWAPKFIAENPDLFPWLDPSRLSKKNPEESWRLP